MIARSLLAAWAADALDPARREEVEAAIAASAPLRVLAEALRAELGAAPPAPPRWRVPPPGLGLAVHVTPVAVLDAAPTATRVRVELPAGDGRVVLLRRETGGWEVVAVLRPTPHVDLATGAEWAVALVESSWDADLDATHDYAALRDGIAWGRVPVTSIRT